MSDDEHLPLRLLSAHQVGNQDRRCERQGRARSVTIAVDRKDFLASSPSRAGLSLGLEMASAPAMPRRPRCRTAAFVPVVVGRDGQRRSDHRRHQPDRARPRYHDRTLDVRRRRTRRPDVERALPHLAAETKYYNAAWHGIQTGGSRSTPSMSPVMRNAARPRERCSFRPLRVSGASIRPRAAHRTRWSTDPGGQRAKYVDLLAAAAALPVPAAVTLKTPDKFKLLGTRQARLDVKPKTNGTAIYGLDVKIPGMKYTLRSRSPCNRGKVASSMRPLRSNTGRAQSHPSAVRRCGDRRQHVGRVSRPQTAQSDVGARSECRRQHRHDLLQSAPALQDARVVLKTAGDVAGPLSARCHASYETPYLAHAPMEPMNTTADVRADSVTLYTRRRRRPIRRRRLRKSPPAARIRQGGNDVRRRRLRSSR